MSLPEPTLAQHIRREIRAHNDTQPWAFPPRWKPWAHMQTEGERNLQVLCGLTSMSRRGCDKARDSARQRRTRLFRRVGGVTLMYALFLADALLGAVLFGGHL